MTSLEGEAGTRCAECVRLREAYLQALRKVGQWGELLYSGAEHNPDLENIRQELQRAEDIRIAAREAWLNHQTTRHCRV
jgi:hypothetical protein